MGAKNIRTFHHTRWKFPILGRFQQLVATMQRDTIHIYAFCSKRVNGLALSGARASFRAPHRTYAGCTTTMLLLLHVARHSRSVVSRCFTLRWTSRRHRCRLVARAEDISVCGRTHSFVRHFAADVRFSCMPSWRETRDRFVFRNV